MSCRQGSVLEVTGRSRPSTAAWRSLLLVLVACVIGTVAAAQEPLIEFLPVGPVREHRRERTIAIYQDHIGYVWSGHARSIRRFDGDKTRQYLLPHVGDRRIRWVAAFAEDAAGNLFAGCRDGLLAYDRSADEWSLVAASNASDTQILRSKLVGLIADADGTLWLSSNSTLASYTSTTGVVAVERPVAASGEIRQVVAGSEGRLLLTLGSGRIASFDPRTRLFESYEVVARTSPSIAGATIRSVCPDPAGTRWSVGTNKGLISFDLATGSGELVTIDPSADSFGGSETPVSLHWDRWGRLWCGTSLRGLQRIDHERRVAYRYLRDPDRMLSLPSNSITCLAEGRDGVMWVGTVYGMCRFDARPHQVNVYVTQSRLARHRQIRDLARDSNGRIWAASNRVGVHVLDVARNQLVTFGKAADGQGLSHRDAHSLAAAPNGDMWIGTWGGGLNYYSAKSQTFEVRQHHPANRGDSASKRIVDLVYGRDGVLWVAMQKELSILDLSTGTCVLVDLPGKLAATRLRRLVPGRDQQLLVVTYGREYFVIDQQTRSVRRFELKEAAEGTPTYIYDAIPDDTGSWICTARSGLYQLKTPGDVWSVMWPMANVAQRQTTRMARDARGNIWGAAVNGGLRGFDPTGVLTAQLTSNGDLFGERPFCALGATSTDERLYFAGELGIVELDPSLPRREVRKVGAILAKVVVRGQPRGGSPSAARTVDLKYDENDVEFECLAFDFLDDSSVQYSHRIRGLDEDWGEARSGRRVRYSSLPGGDYVFEVRARTGEGPWSTETAQVRLHIATPFWKTWWMLLLSVLAAGVLVFGFVRWRLQSAGRINALLTDAITARTAELTEMQSALLIQERMAAIGQLTATVSHEIRNPLGTIASSVFAVRQRTTADGYDLSPQLDRIDRNIVRCDRIIGELLEYGRAAPLKMEQTSIDEWLPQVLDDLLDDVGVEVERRLACNASFAIDRERVRRCLINLLDNAKDALAEATVDAPSIMVLSQCHDGVLEIEVRDNGPGLQDKVADRIFEPLFSTKSFGVGLGLPIVRQIMERHGGAVLLRPGPAGGTSAILRFGAFGDAG